MTSRITNYPAKPDQAPPGELRITNEYVGKRLDVFLREHLSDRSRSQIQKLIKDGFVTVNGKKVLSHYFLKEGDVIEKWGQAKMVSGSISSEIVPDTIFFAPRVIVQTNEYIIIDKPAGMVVHQGVKKEQHTLVDWLLAHYPEIQKVGDDPLRPGIVHRLDKDASGVMVVARTQDSFESLVRQFKLRQVRKEYLALVSGRVTPAEGVIDLPIARSRTHYTKRAAHPAAIPVSPSVIPDSAPGEAWSGFAGKAGIPSRSAITRYSTLDQFKRATFVRVIPETGRTHQIRVHFFAKGNPIVGDSIYASKKIKTPPAPRLMLHAERLGFRACSGEWREYTVPPDKDFENALTQIKSA